MNLEHILLFVIGYTVMSSIISRIAVSQLVNISLADDVNFIKAMSILVFFSWWILLPIMVATALYRTLVRLWKR